MCTQDEIGKRPQLCECCVFRAAAAVRVSEEGEEVMMRMQTELRKKKKKM